MFCLQVSIVGRPLNGRVGEKNLFYGYNGELCGVEELALQYFAQEEGGRWRGVHSESGIWMTIFGLLMWDVIFSDVPNVFCSKFQVTAVAPCFFFFFFCTPFSINELTPFNINELRLFFMRSFTND